MIRRRLFGRARWGRFSGLVGGAYGRCSTDTNPTIPLSDFSYTSQSAADLGAAAHGPSTRKSVLQFSRYAPRNGQLGRPTRSLCSAGPESSGSIRCLLLRDLYAQQPRYMRSSHAMPCYAIGFLGLALARARQFWRASPHDHGELPKDRPWWR